MKISVSTVGRRVSNNESGGGGNSQQVSLPPLSRTSLLSLGSPPSRNYRTAAEASVPQLRERSTVLQRYPRFVLSTLQFNLASTHSLRCRGSYRLEIVQHPLKAAEFGSSTLTRLPLAPALIAQLFFHERSAPEDIE